MLPESVMALDKQQHTAAGVFTALVTYSVSYELTDDRLKATIISIGASALAGWIKEIADKKTTGFSDADLYHTIGGAVVFNLVIRI